MYAQRSIYRHCKTAVGEGVIDDKRKFNPGRPHKLDERDERQVVRVVPKLRKSVGNSFTSKRVKVECNIHHVCDRTISRCLGRHGYKYTTKRSKGVLTGKDLANRKKFANKVLKRLNDAF